MKSFLIPLIALVVVFNAFSADYSDAKTGFYLGLSGNYSNPARLSKINYCSAPGYGGRIGTYMSAARGFVGMSFFLAMEQNAIDLKNSSIRADIYDAYFGVEAILLSIKYGFGVGGLKFSLPGPTNTTNTLTELGFENKRIQMCQSVWTGIHIPIPVENNFLNRWSMDYEYRMLSADRAWMFWHDLVSSMIVGVVFDIGSKIADVLEKENMGLSSTLLTYATVGLAAGYWYLDYDYHNWPWHDERPFRVHRHAIVLNFQISRGPQE